MSMYNTAMLKIEKFLDENGKVIRWPKKWPDRLQVLAYLSEKFEPDTSYHERDMNEILKQWHTFGDWALLRRELYDHGFFERNTSGTEYRRLPQAG